MAETEYDELSSDYDATASDLARMFRISEAAAWRLAREKKLPKDAYTYVNHRTIRYNLAKCRQWAERGGARQ